MSGFTEPFCDDVSVASEAGLLGSPVPPRAAVKLPCLSFLICTMGLRALFTEGAFVWREAHTWGTGSTVPGSQKMLES